MGFEGGFKGGQRLYGTDGEWEGVPKAMSRMAAGSKPHCGQKEWKAVRKRRIGEFGMECRAEGLQRGMEERDYGGL